jgi:hypothetical protein
MRTPAAIVLAVTALTAAGCLGQGTAKPADGSGLGGTAPLGYVMVVERQRLDSQPPTDVHRQTVTCDAHAKTLCAAIVYYGAHRDQGACKSIPEHMGIGWSTVTISGTFGDRIQTLTMGALCHPSAKLANAYSTIGRALVTDRPGVRRNTLRDAFKAAAACDSAAASSEGAGHRLIRSLPTEPI